MTVKVQQIDACRWRIPREGAMRTDGLVFASAHMMEALRREQEDGAMTTGRLAYVDIKDPARKLQTLVPPVPGRELQEAVIAGDKLVLDYQVDLGHRLAVHDLDGELLYEVDFTA